MQTKKIELEIPVGKVARWDENGILRLEDEQPKDIRERIKTFQDAVDWCIEHGKSSLVDDLRNFMSNYGEAEATDGTVISAAPDDAVAYLKVRIIVAALNEGWEPEFKEGEYRYFPWYQLFTNEEVEAMSEQDMNDIGLYLLDSRAVGRSGSNSYAYGGVAYAIASYASSSSYTHHGSRLAFKTSELAEYAGKQFIAIFAKLVAF